MLLIPHSFTSIRVNEVIRGINSGKRFKNMRAVYDADSHVVVMVRIDWSKQLHECISYFWSQLKLEDVSIVSITGL